MLGGRVGWVQLNRTLSALAATVGLWASAFPAIRVALEGYGPTQLSLLRLVVASAALAALLPWVKVRPPARRDLPRILAVGASGMSAYQLLLNWGELHVPAGTAALIVAAVPAISALLAAVLLGERLTPAGIVGSLVALAGTAVIATSTGEASYTAAAWTVLAAAVAQAVYHFAIKPLLRRYSGLEVTLYAMWVGTALLLPLAPSTVHALLEAPADATLAAVYLGLLPSAAGFVVWGYAVARLTVTAATAALYLVPVTALIVAYVWLGEEPETAQLFGGLITLIGVAFLEQPRSAIRSRLGRPGVKGVGELAAEETLGPAPAGGAKDSPRGLCVPCAATDHLDDQGSTQAHSAVSADGGRQYRSGYRTRLLPWGDVAFLGRRGRQAKIRRHRGEPRENRKRSAGRS
ncbi:EamA family transporter [Streptomyces sp. NPDC052721]|uniref:DMT family transporter n=1 Tax=Streptomyces sp. NPDC052721 TaxID=3154955 RepID=UPI00343475D5